MALPELDFLLLILAFFLLITGSWQDLKTREVIDLLWIVMIGGGILIHSIQIILLILAQKAPTEYISLWILNILLAIVLALFLTFSGLGGEADRIAFIAIAVISPISLPIVVLPDSRYEFLISITPRILNTFFNAYLIAVPVPFLIFSYNIVKQRYNPDLYDLSNETILVRVIIRFIGYPRFVQNLYKELEQKPWHFDFLEEFDEEAGWRIIFKARLDTPEADLARKKEIISQIQAEKKKSVWIQPSLPFIFIIMLGFLIDLVVGNLIMLFMVLLV